MSESHQRQPPSSQAEAGTQPPKYRPEDRFWPYVDLAEQPDQEELLAIDPDLRAALYGPQAAPFSLTLAFPRFDGPDYTRAVEMARTLASEYRETGEGEQFRHRARFFPDQALKLRDLFEVVGRLDETQVLIDDRPVPFARELWLPLFWFLIPR